MTFTANFFVLFWFTFCLIPVALDLLPLLLAALVSVFAVFLFLIALGTNLFISHMLGKEIGLPLWMPLPVEGNQSKCLCWKGSKRSFSSIPSFHRWGDRGLERLPDVPVVTEPGAKPRFLASWVSVQTTGCIGVEMVVAEFKNKNGKIEKALLKEAENSSPKLANLI